LVVFVLLPALKKNPTQLQAFSPRKILCLRLARLGDVILLVPSLRALRKHFPKAEISALVGHRCAPVLEMCSAVDKVLSIDRLKWRDGGKMTAARDIAGLLGSLRREKYDLVLDFHSFIETNLVSWITGAPWRMALRRSHGGYLPFCFNLEPVSEEKTLHVSAVFLSLLKPLGIEVESPDISLDLRPHDIQGALSFLDSHGMHPSTPLVSIFVGAGSPGRVWPKEMAAQLAQKLINQWRVGIALISGPREGVLPEEISRLVDHKNCLVASQLSLPGVTALIGRSSLFISNDTGPMHLGPAMGIPTLGLFSLGIPQHYMPLGLKSSFLQRNPLDTLSVEEVWARIGGMPVNLIPAGQI
jgi:ADP-heptose:LPS heptosyltransferase